MKALLSFFAVAFISLSLSAQNAPVDFEPGGFGADWTWTVFENTDNPPLEIVGNPDMSGANVSSTVAKFTATADGQPFAGCETLHGADIGAFSLTPETSTISIMVWKSVISDVGIKLVESSAASLGEIKIANTVTDQWELIEFDFSSMEGIEYDQIVIFPDFADRDQDNIIYFDNITFGETIPLPTPMVAAPDPTEAQENVISLFSDSYASETVTTFLTSWSAAVFQEIDIDGNTTFKYSGVDFFGIETVGGDLIDATEMDYFHVDVWTPNMSTLRIKLVDFGADMAFDGGDDSEHEIIYEDHAQGEWVSYQIPLTDFTGLANMDHMAQYIFSGLPAGGGVLYMDNIYFSKDVEDSVGELGRAELKAFPNPATDTFTVSGTDAIESLSMYNAAGELVMESVNPLNREFNISELPNGVYLVQMISGQTLHSARLIKK